MQRVSQLPDDDFIGRTGRRPGNVVTTHPDPQRWLGSYRVAPIGFGTMQLAGPGVFGPPGVGRTARLLLREVADSGVNHIDTAQCYGPDVVNGLIRDALYPYPPDLVSGEQGWSPPRPTRRNLPDDEPAQLRSGIEDNLRTLDVESLPVVNLRLMRAGGPRRLLRRPACGVDGRATTVSSARSGLATSRLSTWNMRCDLRISPACRIVPPRQPQLSTGSRRVRPAAVAFVPFAPLGSGSNSVLGSPRLQQVAAQLGCTPAQVALAWALHAGPNVVLIPGTSSRRHFRENIAASGVHLDPRSARASCHPLGRADA